MKRKAAIHNLGCKVNSYEAEAMQQLLEEAGYEIVPFEPGADVYIINTCSVTNIADRKSRQMLHKAKKMNPRAIVAAVGCYAQTGREKLEKDPAVDLILGNNRKKNIVESLAEFEASRGPGEAGRGPEDTHLPEEVQTAKSDVIDINSPCPYEDLSIAGTAEHVRVYIKVQDGCNQFCSYCIIPYARGRVRSRSVEDVLREVETLAASGYQEMVLTGIHLSSYGTDLPGGEESLLTLIEAVHGVEGVRRIRLGSLEPRIITEEFARRLSELPKICPHFHLSLQSGCGETLKRMNRRYTPEEYKEKCDLLRKYFRAPALTTDVIVGFPGETEEEFEESCRFVEDIHFYETHIFPYSRRKGTRADAMEGQLSEAVKKARSERLLALTAQRAEEYERAMLGSTLEVLLEEKLAAGGREYLLGHSREYIRAAVPAESGYKVNDIVEMVPGEFLDKHIVF